MFSHFHEKCLTNEFFDKRKIKSEQQTWEPNCETEKLSLTKR